MNKICTTIEQSRKLLELGFDVNTADMCWQNNEFPIGFNDDDAVPAWSLNALLKILHRNEKDIVSLSYGGYKDGEYILNWYLDYEFEDCDYIKTFADNPIDAAFEMVVWLKENGKI